MDYLSICAIAKHELPYIEEWFKYHKGIGVEHFYIYDNSENKELSKFQSPTVSISYVTGGRMQPYAYRDCLKIYRYNTRWLAFIDIDEFIVPIKIDSLKDFLIPYEKYSAVAVPKRS